MTRVRGEAKMHLVRNIVSRGFQETQIETGGQEDEAKVRTSHRVLVRWHGSATSLH